MTVAMRHGAHAVWRSRGFALLVALLVAPAVGMAIVVFSAGRVLFLDPLPYPQADQLVTLGLTDLTSVHPAALVSAPVVAAWTSRSSTLADVAAFVMSDDTRTGVVSPELLSAAQVGPSFFHLLGVRPLLGRSFLASEMTAGHDDAVVLSFDVWMNEFGGTSDLAATTISLDGRRYRVVGVMPKGFTFPPGHTALWRPLVISDALARAPGLWGHAIGRLKPGILPAVATRDLQAMQASIGAEFPVLRRLTPSVVSFRTAAATGYFAAMGTPVLEGRDVLPSDTGGSAPVALIDASLARALWPQGSPVGSDLYVAALGRRPVQVVGVD